LAVLVMALPLLQAGSCVEITERSLINGLFAAITNVLVDNITVPGGSGLAP
jgi:hypothetical protein